MSSSLSTSTIHRYRDPTFEGTTIKIGPGDHYITRDEREMIVTVLGSCVAACIRDPVMRVGGMNHFMLAESTGSSWGSGSASMRYGNYAMERLINDILRNGGQRDRLEVKVFGGAVMMAGGPSVGLRNAEFVEAYLREEGLHIVASHLRGKHARRVNYIPLSGRVMMREMPRDTSVSAAEAGYQAGLRATPDHGAVELFD